MTEPHRPRVETFDAAYVGKLRRECQSKSVRIHVLEARLIQNAIEAESAHAGIDPTTVKADSISVDIAGGVHGAAEAVKTAAGR